MKSELSDKINDLGLTRVEIARRMGISRRTLFYIFDGEREPDCETMVNLSDSSGLTLRQVFVQIAKIREEAGHSAEHLWRIARVME